jgi:MFS family permease
MFGAGAGLGGPLGGYISDNFGWRTAFYFQVPLLIAAAVLVSIHINTDPLKAEAPLSMRTKMAKIDWIGSLTLIIFVGSLLLGLSLKATEDLAWKDPKIWGLLIASVIALAAFVFTEAKVSPHPILPMRLLISRTPLAVALTNL